MVSALRFARRHFFGGCAIFFGAWEASAATGHCPTVTRTVRARVWRKILAALWLLGVAWHLLRDAVDEIDS